MSVEYGQDLRSKSDAQIAECVISEEVAKVNGRYSKRPRIAPGTIYKYKVPKYIKYQSEQLNNMLSIVANADFVVKENGSIEEERMGIPAYYHDVIHWFAIKVKTSDRQGLLTRIAGKDAIHMAESCDVPSANMERTALISCRDPQFVRYSRDKVDITVTVPIGHEDAIFSVSNLQFLLREVQMRKIGTEDFCECGHHDFHGTERCGAS